MAAKMKKDTPANEMRKGSKAVNEVGQGSRIAGVVQLYKVKTRCVEEGVGSTA
jgi:hypothetical protein